MVLERLSLEVTNQCAKTCWFCYNHSSSNGKVEWTPTEIITFIKDCAAQGVKAVSFGGGEPLQYKGIFEILRSLRGVLFRSLTTNGYFLRGHWLDKLAAVAPNKVHVSIHFPEDDQEVNRVIQQVGELRKIGIPSGINLLVARSNLEAARRAGVRMHQAGITNERIIYLPMRGQDTPTAEELAPVAGGIPFQSTSCLTECGKSPRFCSIGWDKSVAWCSYTATRRQLGELTYRGLVTALNGLGVQFCGGTASAETLFQIER